jgi:hypothetical protein
LLLVVVWFVLIVRLLGSLSLLSLSSIVC